MQPTAAAVLSSLQSVAPVKISADEIQEELKHNGVEVTPEQAMAIKKAPRDIVSPTHIIDLLLQDNNSDELLKRLMFQILDTDKLRKVTEIYAAEYYSWSMQKQAIELFDRLIVQITIPSSCYGRNKKTAKRLAMRFEYVAGAEGLEPSTYGFGDRRSTN